MGHPCLSCGACCAHFRVAFHWSESDHFSGGRTPAELTETLDPHRLVMRGTQAHRPHCIALGGDIGLQVACRIYEERPSPCRELEPAWASGRPSPQCDRARLAHGLPPLAPGWTDAVHVACAVPRFCGDAGHAGNAGAMPATEDGLAVDPGLLNESLLSLDHGWRA